MRRWCGITRCEIDVLPGMYATHARQQVDLNLDVLRPSHDSDVGYPSWCSRFMLYSAPPSSSSHNPLAPSCRGIVTRMHSAVNDPCPHAAWRRRLPGSNIGLSAEPAPLSSAIPSPGPAPVPVCTHKPGHFPHPSTHTGRCPAPTSVCTHRQISSPLHT